MQVILDGVPTLMAATDMDTGAVTLSSDQVSPFTVNGSVITDIIETTASACLDPLLALIGAHVDMGGSMDAFVFESNGTVTSSDAACGDGYNIYV